MSDAPTATVYTLPDGTLVLDDPVALAVMRVLDRRNCRQRLVDHAEAIIRFRQRIEDRGMSAATAIIVLVCADSNLGPELADVLGMPEGWDQPFREKGELPFARGIAHRAGMQDILDQIDPDAGNQLRNAPGLCVLVVDFNTFEVFEIEPPRGAPP
jgi:hypothetical protein